MSELKLMLEILQTLPRYPEGVTVGEIVERLNLMDGRFNNRDSARRAVQRTLQRISADGVFAITTKEESVEPGRAPHWCFAQDAKQVQFPRMSTQSALSWELTETVVEGFLPAAICSQLSAPLKQAGSQITALASQGTLRNKIRVLPSRSFLMPPQLDEDMLSNCLLALVKEVPIKFQYFSRSKNKPFTGMLHPLLLVIQAPVIYLVGRLSGLDEIRVLAIHRFEEVTLRPDKEFRPKMRFNPDKWLEESLFNIEREQTEITFIMDKDVAFHLDETKLSNDQKYKKLRDGRSQVTATVRVSEELIWWFLGFGDCVEIVAPKKLRDKVAKRIRAAAELYD